MAIYRRSVQQSVGRWQCGGSEVINNLWLTYVWCLSVCPGWPVWSEPVHLLALLYTLHPATANSRSQHPTQAVQPLLEQDQEKHSHCSRLCWIKSGYLTYYSFRVKDPLLLLHLVPVTRLWTEHRFRGFDHSSPVSEHKWEELSSDLNIYVQWR